MKWGTIAWGFGLKVWAIYGVTHGVPLAWLVLLILAAGDLLGEIVDRRLIHYQRQLINALKEDAP